MDRCYACDEHMSESTHKVAARLGYLGTRARPTKYLKWGMIIQNPLNHM